MSKLEFASVARASTLAATLALSAPAFATITLPGGDVFQDASFVNLNYGPNPGALGIANISPRLFISQFAETKPPFLEAQGTDLVFNYNASGLGTNRFVIDYSLHNASAATTFTDLRLFVNVEPSGPVSFLDHASQSWGAKAAFDPDTREIGKFDVVNFNNNLLGRIDSQSSNPNLNDGADACGAASCDADFALQWNRAQLAPGETWAVSLAMSDTAANPASNRFLRAVSVDDPATMLTVSAVPEPETYLMFLAGIGVLALASRRRRTVAAATDMV